MSEGGEPNEREWLEGLRYEDKFPAEGGEARNHETVETVIAEVLDAHGALMRAGERTSDHPRESNRWNAAMRSLGALYDSLDAVRCAQGREADLVAVRRELSEAGILNPGEPLGSQVWRLRVRADVAMAEVKRLRCAQGRDTDAPEVDRLRAGISFVRGLCTDRASYSVIDERLGELLDGETT